MDHRLELYIPVQKETDGQNYLLQPKPLKAWIEGLPWANVGEISKQIYKGLIEFNRSRVSQKECLVIVELFRKPVSFVTKNLEKHFIDTGFPLSKRSRKIANLTYELSSELAIAYKIAINHFLHASRLDKTEKKWLVLAIHHAIFYLSKVIIQSALVYDPVSPRIWYEINGLFDYAKRHGLEQVKVKDVSNDKADVYSTIADIYKQILLFSLASPGRLRQREILQLSTLLQQWGPYAELQERDQQADLSNKFLVLVDKDSPPVHLSLAKSNSANTDERQLILDTTTLLEKVGEQLSSAEEQDDRLACELTSNRLLRRFIQPWSTAPQREFVRTQLNFELNVAVGLNAIYTLLESANSNESGVSDELKEDMNWLDQPVAEEGPMGWSLENHSRTSAFTLTPIEDSLDIRRGDFEDFGPQSRDRHEPDPVVPLWGGANEQETLICETYKFRTINESAGGYCLDWRSGEPSMVRVGELIGIQSPSISGQYGVAAIRWILTQGEQGLQAGVEMLAPSARPVEVGVDDEFQVCLLLPGVGGSEQQSNSLITSPHAFQPNSNLTINEKSCQRPIRLLRMLESTGAFSRYQFNYLDLAEEASEEESAGFDNLWSSL
ncbi:MAG: hypothetical protein L3J28_04040 [Candidatus Polarisedimenticolaceae bacterium]|nr:hypothetical protein [Candidatus Polarisedimenticolaceae bacterium]